MCSLDTFPPPPLCNRVTVCEKEGAMRDCHVDNPDVYSFTDVTSFLPDVQLGREMQALKTSRKMTPLSPFLPTGHTPIRTALTTLYKDGLMASLQELSDSSDRDNPQWYSRMAEHLMHTINWIWRFDGTFSPHYTLSPSNLCARFSTVRDWMNSLVRCMEWHPFISKVALALHNDSVHVFTTDNERLQLKCQNQKGVTCLSWRPLSSSDLAVGCEMGVFLWSSNRSQPVAMLGKQKPINTMAWHPQGLYLATGSSVDCNVLLWDMTLDNCSPIYQLGLGGVSLLAWSPNGRHLVVASPLPVFRVWDTELWVSERWDKVSVQAACFNPNSSVLLFCTKEEPTVFALNMVEYNPEFNRSNMLAASSVIYLKETNIDTEEGTVTVGGDVQMMKLDQTGSRLAISFKTTDFIALFQMKFTPTVCATPCGFIQGAPSEYPNCILFQHNFNEGSLLTIAWSSGRVQHFPSLFYCLPESEESFEYHKSFQGNTSIRGSPTGSVN